MSSSTSASCCRWLRPRPKPTRKAASSASAASKSARRNRPRSTKSAPHSTRSRRLRNSRHRQRLTPNRPPDSPLAVARKVQGQAPRGAFAGSGERGAGDDQGHPECKKREVPAERRAEVVAHVVDAEQLVIDDALDDVEDTPTGEQHAEMNAPRRRQLAALPGTDYQQHRRDDQEPSREVEEAVGERVVLQAGHGGA